MSERINIKWRPGASKSDREFLRNNRGLKKVAGYELLEAEGWEVCELPFGLQKKTVEWLNNHPNVEVAEAEGFGEAIPIEEREAGLSFSVEEVSEWYQTFVGAPLAHTKTRGFGAVGAIFDNGLNPHPWLAGKIIEEKLFRNTETNGTLGGSHGNPVTGCALAIAPEAKVTNYKIASSADAKCSWTDVSNGFLYAKQQGHKIFNLSYGGGSSLLLVDTLVKCKQAGIAIFVAAGNSSTATQFPANNANVYAVSSVATSGMISGFSCRGKIEIAAPGEGLLTTNDSAGWGYFSGTSGASPIAFGGCLLVSAQNPTWTGVQCAERVLATATAKLPTTDYGAGLLNAAAAVGASDVIVPPPIPPMNAPTLVNLTSTSVTFSWEQTGATGYELYQGAGYKFQQVGPTVFSYTWSPLKPSIDYRVAVKPLGGMLSPYLTFKTPATDEPPPPPPPVEEPNLLVSTLSALVVIEADIPGYTRQVDKDELKTQLNRLIGLIK